MSEYKDFSNTVFVGKEGNIKEFVPSKGKFAGKKTNCLEFQAYRPEFEKLPDGTFKRKENSTWYSIQYYGTETACKRISAGIIKGVMLEVRGDITTREYTGKDNQPKTENVIIAKGLAISLNQPGISIQYTPQKQQAKAADKGVER